MDKKGLSLLIVFLFFTIIILLEITIIQAKNYDAEINAKIFSVRENKTVTKLVVGDNYYFNITITNTGELAWTPTCKPSATDSCYGTFSILATTDGSIGFKDMFNISRTYSKTSPDGRKLIIPTPDPWAPQVKSDVIIPFKARYPNATNVKLQLSREGIKSKVAIFLLVDLSGSMSSALSNEKSAVKSFVTKINDFYGGDTSSMVKVGVITFSDDAKITVSLGDLSSSQVDKINSAVNQFSADGSTATAQAIKKAQDGLKNVPSNYDQVIVLMTDGNPKCDESNNCDDKNMDAAKAYTKEVANDAKDNDMLVYTIGLKTTGDTDCGLLREVASDPDSQFTKCPVTSASDLTDVYNAVAGAINKNFGDQLILAISKGVNPICGNNISEGREMCDNGTLNTNSPCTANYNGVCFYCNTTCSVKNSTGPFCGDKIVQGNAGEECDNGMQCSNGADCTSSTQCSGNGDGLCRPRSLDGCSQFCEIEGSSAFWGDKNKNPIDETYVNLDETGNVENSSIYLSWVNTKLTSNTNVNIEIFAGSKNIRTGDSALSTKTSSNGEAYVKWDINKNDIKNIGTNLENIFFVASGGGKNDESGSLKINLVGEETVEINSCSDYTSQEDCEVNDQGAGVFEGNMEEYEGVCKRQIDGLGCFWQEENETSNICVQVTNITYDENNPTTCVQPSLSCKYTEKIEGSCSSGDEYFEQTLTPISNSDSRCIAIGPQRIPCQISEKLSFFNSTSFIITIFLITIIYIVLISKKRDGN